MYAITPASAAMKRMRPIPRSMPPSVIAPPSRSHHRRAVEPPRADEREDQIRQPRGQRRERQQRLADVRTDRLHDVVDEHDDDRQSKTQTRAAAAANRSDPEGHRDQREDEARKGLR